LAKHRGIQINLILAFIMLLLIGVVLTFPQGVQGLVPMSPNAMLWALIFITIFFNSLWEIIRGYREHTFANWAANILTILIVGAIGNFVFLLRQLPEGSSWLVILFGFNWIYDSAAMFAGRFFGRRKLARTISPTKTIEGMIGGLFINALAAIGAFYFWLPATLGFSLWGFIVLGMVMGILAQIGDLVESMLKRWSGAKDSSGFIPGHGGILDKIDNLIFTAPVLYGIAWLVVNP
jgi:phosphatidate cytidylyltransferase